MIKKHLTDILCAALSMVIIPLIVVDKPAISYNTKITEMETSQAEGQNNTIENVYDGRNYENIEARNIFSPDGLYKLPEEEVKEETAAEEILPETTYSLVGVLVSDRKMAVLKTDTGFTITSKVGDELIDGSIITEIDDLSVKLKKNNKETELKIFNPKF